MKHTLTPRGGVRIAGLILAALSAGPAAATESTARPNILLVVSDDQSYPHTSADGDASVRTPAFDGLARAGVRFTHAFCSSPSCTPSRAALLSGQDFSRLREGANLNGVLPRDIPLYPELLEAQGYHVGYTGKGWAPGSLDNGREQNPAGAYYSDFKSFLKSVPRDKPFCFWYGAREPHRPYRQGSGLKGGGQPDGVVVPRFLPDLPAIRSDLLDYYAEIESFDRQLAGLLGLVEASGQADNTLIVVTSDNGMPFPHGKANLYDAGTREPLAVRWPARVKGGRVLEDFVSLVDLAPTFLETAGQTPAPEMTGRSLLDLLFSDHTGRVDPSRDKAFFGRERHAECRAGNVGYPSRGVRTDEFLYIRNFEPSRWPAGDPDPPSRGHGGEPAPRFGDVDAPSPSKSALMNASGKDARLRRFREIAFGKRPAEELYDVRSDPDSLTNLAGNPRYEAVQRELREQLQARMARIEDPRAKGESAPFDHYPYYRADTSRPRTPARAAPAKKRQQ